MSSDPLDEIKIVFFQECSELLEELEDGLYAMRDGEETDDTVNAVFRAVHSIKGGAGAFGLDVLVSVSHQFETVLDKVRSNQLETDPDLLDLFMRSADKLQDLVQAAKDGRDPDASECDELVVALKAYESPGEAAPPPAAPATAAPDENGFQVAPLDLDFGLDDDPTPAAGNWQVTFTPHVDLYQRGNDCCRLIGILIEMGATNVRLTTDTAPIWSELPAETPFMAWHAELPSDVPEADIREVFEFVEDDCDLKVEAAAAQAGADDMGFTPTKLDILGDDEVEFTPMKLDIDLDTPADTPAAEPEIEAKAEPEAESKKNEKVETAKPVAAAPPKRVEPKAEAKSEASSTIRVDLNRVDRLINLIGELVINQSMLAQGFQSLSMPVNQQLTDGLNDLRQLTRDIQDSVMAIRAQPIKPLFRRMSRIVRESGEATGKKVQLVTEGEGTEIDKTIIERLSDPLTHMIRNAVDHGLEGPEKRIESGKEDTGTVRLTAVHRSGRVVIEVADDGAGINRKKVREIAVEKGLISDDAELTDSEIDHLLFMPGFSTAKEVSNLSGRGVGMDVVKRSIQNLGGRVSIESEPGKGSVFTISLPLTLAVMDGMIVRVEDQLMVVSLSEIIETIRPSATAIQHLTPTQSVILVRGEYVPVIDVGYELGVRPRLTDAGDGVVLLSETEAGERSALLLDGILDQRQVVIKGLEDNYGDVPGVAAVTILGDGNIALILDVDGLLRLSEQSRLSSAA
ncbi:MAG: chemotaxis protein CheA [Pseudomonadota bacterium]